MRSLLTRTVFRQIIYNELYSSSKSWHQPAPQCLRLRRTPNPVTMPKRSLFGFSRKPKREPRPVDYDPGYEPMLVLSDRLRKGERTQPAEEMAQAFVELFASKKRQRRPLEDIQAQHALTTFSYLKKSSVNGEGIELTGEELRSALNVLATIYPDYKHNTHNKLAKALFGELLERRETPTDDQEALVGLELDLLPFIQVLAQSGDTLYARDLVEQYWETCLKNSPISPWSKLMRGMIFENRIEELEKTLQIMQKCNVPNAPRVHRTILICFAYHKEDIELTKKWYNHPIASSEPPSPRTDSIVLKLCIKRNELEWGESIFKSLLERSSEDRATWNIIFQWAAAKGRGVDEIERMMQVMTRRSKEDGTDLRPDIEIINGLMELANSRNDAYTAERYLALGQRWGLQPDASTYLLQLDYRIKVGDLGGARTAYAHLRGEGVYENNDLPLINRLIVALSAQERQNYDAIMGLVEDLSERKARFEPDTVAALSLIHLQRGEMEDLVDLLNTFAFHYGLDQRASIRDVLLQFCLDSSTPTSRAWETYNVLRQTFGETDIPTRTALMKNFFTRNRPDMATHVFGHMRQQQIKSLRPTVSTYAECLAGIGRASDDESLGTVHNMIKLDSEIEPNTQLNNALMLSYSECGKTARALQFWEDIVHSKEGPSYASIQIALQACEKAIGFGEEIARDIWGKLKKFEIEVTREIYAAYVGALAGQNLFDECVALIDNTETETGYKPDALLLGTFYNAIPGGDSKVKVKEWAWEAYPAAYEDLLKLGTYTIVELNSDGEEDETDQSDLLFKIGPIGRDVDP